MHIILSSLTITFFVLCYISINKYITKYRIVKNEKPIKEYIIQGVTKKQVKMNVNYYLIISYNNQIYDVLINREQCNDNSIQKMKLYYDKTHNEVFEAKKSKECHLEIFFVCFSIVVGFASVFRIYYYWKDRNERKRNIKRKKEQYNRAYTKNCQSFRIKKQFARITFGKLANCIFCSEGIRELYFTLNSLLSLNPRRKLSTSMRFFPAI